jgi:type I restriction enzyme R subunit
MQDHGLFQAICRVNRVDDDSKDYGYIVDYKDLFKSLQKSINDYTSEAFDEYDEEDVKGLLTNRYTASRERLETALETVIAMCEPVHPKDEPNFIRYFCGNTENPNDLKATEERRVALYKAVVSLIRAYSDIANEMHKIGYDEQRADDIKQQVQYYSDLRDTIKRASGDYIDLKRFEPGMRQLMDMYLDAKSSKKISDLDNKTLVELIVKLGEESEEGEEAKRKKKRESVSETIENNVRKVIIEESQTNPKYYEKMSKLLDELIQQRKNETLEYQEYLKRITALAQSIANPNQTSNYPVSLTTSARRALYDNLDQDEELAIMLDSVVQYTKNDGWRDGGIREKKVRIAVNGVLQDEEKTVEIMKIIKAQSEY